LKFESNVFGVKTKYGEGIRGGSKVHFGFSEKMNVPSWVRKVFLWNKKSMAKILQRN